MQSGFRRSTFALSRRVLILFLAIHRCSRYNGSDWCFNPTYGGLSLLPILSSCTKHSEVGNCVNGIPFAYQVSSNIVYCLLLQPYASVRSIVGCVEGDGQTQQFIPELVQMYKDGKLPLDKISTKYHYKDLEKVSTTPSLLLSFGCLQ